MYFVLKSYTVVVRFLSALLGDIEAADDAVTATDGKHLAAVAKVGREAGPRQVVDTIAWLKEAVTVEDFDLI